MCMSEYVQIECYSCVFVVVHKPTLNRLTTSSLASKVDRQRGQGAKTMLGQNCIGTGCISLSKALIMFEKISSCSYTPQGHSNIRKGISAWFVSGPTNLRTARP